MEEGKRLVEIRRTFVSVKFPECVPWIWDNLSYNALHKILPAYKFPSPIGRIPQEAVGRIG
jgi:hypothetical protein